MNKNELRARAEFNGIGLATYSPGDGTTRYRFTRTAGISYFEASGSDLLGTVLGSKAAETWLEGFGAGIDLERRRWGQA